MVQPLLPSARKAIAKLKELLQLGVSDLEQKLGHSLPLAAQKAFHSWMARAFEAGRDSRPTHESARRVAAFLEKSEIRDRSAVPSRRQQLNVELAAMWNDFTPEEQALVRKHRGSSSK